MTAEEFEQILRESAEKFKQLKKFDEIYSAIKFKLYRQQDEQKAAENVVELKPEEKGKPIEIKPENVQKPAENADKPMQAQSAEPPKPARRPRPPRSCRKR